MDKTRLKYTKEQMSALNTIPISEVLYSLGKDGHEFKGSKYYSPFHDESTPSFHVDKKRNVWFDHGEVSLANPGGSAIDLVILVKHGPSADLDPRSDWGKENINEACEHLSGIHPGMSYSELESAAKARREAMPESSKIEILYAHNIYHSPITDDFARNSLNVSPSLCHNSSVFSSLLRNYAIGQRAIPGSILDRYCWQVAYKTTGYDRTFYAIGFPNVNGGWALRMASEGKNGKRSSGAGYTVITPGGDFLSKDDLAGYEPNRNVVIFEGFMDFMSWLAWRKTAKPGNVDVVVLNSVAMADRAQDFINRHEKVCAYLDADRAGTETTQRIRDNFFKAKGIGNTEQEEKLRRESFIDGRYVLKGANDMNEIWCRSAAAARRETKGRERREVQARYPKGQSEDPGDTHRGMHR